MKTIAGLVLTIVMLATGGQASSCGRSSPKSSGSSSGSQSTENKTNINRGTEKGSVDAVNSNANDQPQKGDLPPANEYWGGDHIRLKLRPDGGDLTFDCAHGTIDAALKTDDEGRFDLPGRFLRENAGPIRPPREQPHPARYSGRIEGTSMTLNIRLTDIDQTLQTFVLTKGSMGRIWRCR
jgi:hypothetical protein